ncbi:methionyl-tRNA formyltransferase [Tropilaelaps mercedesae]|uniref:methionyl-tRNA formyltransferase n=1 Tax=Tropilaelaps mercedesae TaxID=418985 RepID=A0A1V9Y321_9ACAR|nr:methionyl-tRNA formyltransferase [Tropilaelaps mercedesae]
MVSIIGHDALRVLFYGSDKFSLVSLRALLSLQLPLTVVTKHCCPVYEVAHNAGLTIKLWPFTVPKGDFDLGVVVSFGHLIPAASICACRYGMVNVHPSLLPRWRGPAPLVHTILANDERTGVSLITVAKNKFDTGAIIKQRLLKESPRNLEYRDLERLTATMGADMLTEFISDVDGALAKAYAQSDEGATKAPKIKASMAELDWQQSLLQVDCQRRAIANFEPLTTWFEKHKLRLSLLPLRQRPPDPDVSYDTMKVKKMRNDVSKSVPSSSGILCPGYVYYHKKRRLIAVLCRDGWVWVDFVCVAGKKKMTAQDFYAGFLNKSTCKVFTREPITLAEHSKSKTCTRQINEA